MDRCWWWSSPTTAGHSCTSASACCSSRWHFCPSNKKGKMQHLEIFRICLVAWADRSSLKISLKNISLIFQHIYIYIERYRMTSSGPRNSSTNSFSSLDFSTGWLLCMMEYAKGTVTWSHPRGGPHRPAVTIESCLASCWKHGYRSWM